MLGNLADTLLWKYRQNVYCALLLLLLLLYVCWGSSVSVTSRI